MKEKAKKILTLIGENILFILYIVMLLLLIYVISMEIKFNNEIIQVDGVIVDKDETKSNHIFVLMKDDGNVVRFSVDIDDWYAYEISRLYSCPFLRSFMKLEGWSPPTTIIISVTPAFFNVSNG